MGILLSRVRKKKSVSEALEKLDNDIKENEKIRMNVKRKSKLSGLLFMYFIVLYVLCSIILYFQYTTSLKAKLLYLSFPLLLYFVKIIISWYFARLINKTQTKLNEMKKEKKRILEEVMDKETYKVAKEILEKFSCETAQKPSNKLQLMCTTESDDGIRKRIDKGISSFISTSGPNPKNVGKSLMGNQTLKPVHSSLTPLNSLSAPVSSIKFLPAPILPLHQSYVDRIMEYLIGDGANNRYALICSQCHSHNGMALKEEFEYISYKCCYCFCYNPARKVRPEAPKLEGSSRVRQASESDSEKTSGENSDAEHKVSLEETFENMEISDVNKDVDLINLDSGTYNNDEAHEEGKSSAVVDSESHSEMEVEPFSEKQASSDQSVTDAKCDSE